MTDPTRSRSGRAVPEHRLRRMRASGLKPPIPDHAEGRRQDENAIVDCGWGRLLFAQTFSDPQTLIEAIRAEAVDRRDIAFYVRDPHVLLGLAPQDLFLDPSHTYRLELATYRPSRRTRRGFSVRRLSSAADAEAVNRIYATRNMVPVPPEFFWTRHDNRSLLYLVAEDAVSGEVIGTVTGIDHSHAFGDRERGSSLWCLAVDPQASHPGIGEALVRRLAEQLATRGVAYMDLSVLHDNEHAIALYEKLGFHRVPFFAVKRKNPINERLFVGPERDEGLNPYAKIIVDEARRRGIHVEITDPEGGFFRLTYGGRSIRCRESLSDLTSAVAMSICDDKAVTRRIVSGAGVKVPEQVEAGGGDDLAGFLERHGKVVVKPARGEQGRGVAVGLETMEEIEDAVAAARAISDRVVVESYVEGLDLRLVVIDYRLVAAAIRRPARIVGDGRSTVRTLIEHQSRRRAAATGGESRIPLDQETERAVRSAGYGLDDVPPPETEITVRKAANLHTGGTIHDVTDEVHPELVAAAVKAARAIEIPVVGIDLLVTSPRGPAYVFIEANERPGLANHEPQPTAERFVDLLFPLAIPQAARMASAGFDQRR
ncbi:N-acetylglutaminylglutamine synthetase [Propylenella binzhouense]|uniref:N-acetylglutaminylglutamine synthetase n=1 Tax=Propylenella binzhouense TaxID=2555902 RepID=A0A964WS86_9HYPH|nr:N-acetylglutaminylglutamine synthetase [Propylenella binzhouense]MYZ46714.1 N-acetylglutaminylglutamine synthetase [Propylenella binzhouense]